ncbi:hypothetical protein [Thalassovita sp.]|uniref:hypothetical protein n=1 Tax=Thalassovita sp. TaxID=1979401 RepID=UPI002B266EB8|nr:hypothetical protein [Thalassovita sp.]
MRKTILLSIPVITLLVSALFTGIASAGEDGSKRISIAGALTERVGTSVTVREIEEAGLHDFTLFNPYDQREDKYTGVLFSDLVAKFGAENVQSITLTAIDDYIIEFSREEWNDLQIVLSTRVNGEYIGFDKKGPMRVVFPDYDATKPEYQETLPKWIWMITRIEFKE